MKDKEAIRQYLNSVWETMDNNPDSITREDFDRILDNATHCRLIFLEGSIAAIMPQLRSELKDILPPNTTCDIALNVIVKTCSDIFYTIGQKKCPMPSAKIRNYSHSHNLVSQ